MRIIKLGIIIAAMAILLVGCKTTRPEMTELSKEQIQADVLAHLSEAYQEGTVEVFAVASDTGNETTKTIIGTLTIKAAIATVTGNFTSTYEASGTTWVIKTSAFAPTSYTNVDQASWPTQSQLESDLKSMVLPFMINSVDQISVEIEEFNAWNLVYHTNVVYQSEIGKVTAQIRVSYIINDLKWELSGNEYTFVSITDFTQMPDQDDMLEWSITNFAQGDTDTGITTQDSHLVSSVFNNKTGVMTNIYHVDKQIDSNLRYIADTVVTGTYVYEVGWVIETAGYTLEKIVDLSGSYHMVWDLIKENETVFVKGESIDLDLNGTLKVLYKDDKESRTLSASGTLVLNGETKTIELSVADASKYGSQAVQLKYGTDSNDMVILSYEWSDIYNGVGWVLKSTNLSEAYIKE